MRPTEVTKEEIIDAGQTLLSGGRNITGFALRQKIGSGNAVRLKDVWDEYIVSQKNKEVTTAAELPTELTEELAGVTQSVAKQLATLVNSMNDKAVKAANRKVVDVLKSADEQRKQNERELADASAMIEDLEAKLALAVEQSDNFTAKLKELYVAQHAQEIELVKVIERLHQSEQVAERAEANRDKARDEAAKLMGQIELLKSKV